MQWRRLGVIAVLHPFQLVNFIQIEFLDDGEERVEVEAVGSLNCSNVLSTNVVELKHFPSGVGL